jgi:hypothetical protein
MVVQEFQSLRIESCLEVKEEKDFLHTCSSADADTNFFNYLSGANCQSTAYVSLHSWDSWVSIHQTISRLSMWLWG